MYCAVRGHATALYQWQWCIKLKGFWVRFVSYKTLLFSHQNKTTRSRNWSLLQTHRRYWMNRSIFTAALQTAVTATKIYFWLIITNYIHSFLLCCSRPVSFSPSVVIIMLERTKNINSSLHWGCYLFVKTKHCPRFLLSQVIKSQFWKILEQLWTSLTPLTFLIMKSENWMAFRCWKD